MTQAMAPGGGGSIKTTPRTSTPKIKGPVGLTLRVGSNPLAPAPKSAPKSAPRVTAPSYPHQTKAAKIAYNVLERGHVPTPKEVKIVQQANAEHDKIIKASYPDHSGGGPLGIAAIHVPHVHIPLPSLKDVGDVAGAAGRDVLSLPKQTLVGSEALGKAFVNDTEHRVSDLIHGRVNITGSNPYSDISSELTRPYTQLAGYHGGYKAIGKEFKQHPLFTALNYTPLIDSPGRLIGMAGRSGMLGDRLAEAASTAREPDVFAGGVRGEERRYSGNIFTKRLQQHMDESSGALAQQVRNARYLRAGGTQSIRHAPEIVKREVSPATLAATNRINRHVDLFYNTHLVGRRHATAEAVQSAMDALKGHDDLVKQNIGHAIVGQMRRADTMHPDLQAVADEIDRHLAAHDQGISPYGEGNAGANAAKVATYQRDSLHRLLNSPRNAEHAASLMDLKSKLSPLLNEIDRRAGQRGLYEPSQMERRVNMTYAQQHAGARYADGTGEENLTSRAHDYTAAAKELNDATKELKTASEWHHRVSGIRGRGSIMAMDSEVKDAERRVTIAEKAEQRLIGRVGGEGTSVKASRLLDARNRVERAREAADHIRRIASEERQFTRGDSRAAFDAAKDRVKDARRQEAALRPYKGERHKNVWVYDDPHTGFAHVMTNEAIHQHMADNGVDSLAYMNARTPSEEREAQMSGTWRGGRGDAKQNPYTGESARLGTWDAGASGVLNTITRGVSRLEQARAHDDFIRDLATHRNLTPAEAQVAQREWELANPGQKLVAMNQHSKPIEESRMNVVRNNQNPDHAEATHNLELLNARQIGDLTNHDPNERVSLVPQEAVRRYTQHLEGEKKFRQFKTLNRMFRNTVLPTSTKWFAGNAIEAGLRSVLSRHGYQDWAFAKKVLDGMDPQSRAELMAHWGEGLHMGSVQRANYEKNVYGGLRAPAMGEEGAAVAQATVKRNWKHIANLYGHYRDAVFALNRKVENSAEMAAFGAHAKREMQDMAGSWKNAVNAQEDYLDSVRQGYMNPEKAEAAARYIHDTLGKYAAFSPAMKTTINTFAPFLPWYMNAVKFVYHTMPVDHPYMQAALLADHNAQHQVNPGQPYGVDFLGTKVGDLTSGIQNTKNDSVLNLGRYTPFGAFTDSGPLGNAMSAALPYGSPVILASTAGDTPFGQPIKGDDGKAVSGGSWESTQYALNEILSSFAGPVNVVQRIAQQGGTPRDTDYWWHHPFATKPGSEHGQKSVLNGVNRVLNPFRPTYLGGSSSGSSGGNSVASSNVVSGGNVVAGNNVVSGGNVVK